MKKNTLVIISVPFPRIVKHILSDVVLNPICKRAEVVIVSPFANNQKFIEDFSNREVSFNLWESPVKSCLFRNFIGATELMRRLGYWRKNRSTELKYYLLNQYTSFGINGADKYFGPVRRLAYWLLSFIGEHPNAWRVAEKILGKSWYRLGNQALLQRAEKYQNVILIQSANWGLQDRSLARLCVENKWRSVLLPYTTDQIFTNGFLINDFDAICVQGDFEYVLARNYHKVEDKNIYRVGSVWFRTLHELKTDFPVINDKANTEVRIIYAGVSNVFFPTDSEFKGLDALIKYVSKIEKNVKIIYRPVVFDANLKQDIISRYECIPEVEIDWPDETVFSLSEYNSSVNDSLRNYARSIVNCDLLVMSYMTSFCMDVAFLSECGVISNMIDSNNILESRHNELFPTNLHPGLCVCKSTKDLICNVDAFLQSSIYSKKQASEIISLWDYPDSDVQGELINAIFGS
ncbi:hypothetical protein [Marinobacterium sp. LSUCC0821]|uniref:hypothetical protein n=1 Tax=Marinobacterium sp. LSUCC0821 TaxID=2668067 RepID=UPI001452369C|nr:hypothetical protein [Marinobacterium sp. LSUCC0821]QJD72168.1 hypothetical protein HH196_10895 [Marinobacterium sp. LSUCC0821]